MSTVQKVAFWLTVGFALVAAWVCSGCDCLPGEGDAGELDGGAALVDATPVDAGHVDAGPDADVFVPCSVEPPDVTCWDAAVRP